MHHSWYRMIGVMRNAAEFLAVVSLILGLFSIGQRNLQRDLRPQKNSLCESIAVIVAIEKTLVHKLS